MINNNSNITKEARMRLKDRLGIKDLFNLVTAIDVLSQTEQGKTTVDMESARIIKNYIEYLEEELTK